MLVTVVGLDLFEAFVVLGEYVLLKHNPVPQDENAVRVEQDFEGGGTIGFLDPNSAKAILLRCLPYTRIVCEIRDLLDNGRKATARVELYCLPLNRLTIEGHLLGQAGARFVSTRPAVAVRQLSSNRRFGTFIVVFYTCV